MTIKIYERLLADNILKKQTKKNNNKKRRELLLVCLKLQNNLQLCTNQHKCNISIRKILDKIDAETARRLKTKHLLL